MKINNFIIFRCTGDEDCLFLNVWTPSLNSSARRDVMVFVHGGGTLTGVGKLYGPGLLTGSGHEPGEWVAISIHVHVRVHV